MNQQELIYDLSPNGVDRPQDSGIDINPKRVLARILKYWYLIVLSCITALSIAYVINRYSTRIYPVRASIIILQNEENAGAKFLYNNELINPFRNFYNEIFIMRSYPLLSQVVEELKFDVSFYREGNIKLTEFYDRDFPIEFKMLGSRKPYGRALNFVVNENNTFSLELLFDEKTIDTKRFDNLHFDDTIKINGYSFIVHNKEDVSNLINKVFLVRFNDPFLLARSYAGKLMADWAQPGASVVNLEVKGEVPQKEIDFLNKFIENYQQYDVDKKNKMATMAMQFLDAQLSNIGDSLNLLEDKVEDFKHRNVITNLGSETDRLYLKMEGLEEQKFQFKLRENYYAYVERLLANDQYDGIFTPSSVGVTDNVVAGLITSLIEVRRKIVGYGGLEKGNENPLFQEQLIRQQQIKGDILKTIQNTRKTDAINSKFMDSQIALLRQELRGIPSSERELIDIQRDYSLKEKLYLFLLQKRTEAGLSKASTVSDIVVVNPPLAGGAVYPKEGINYLIAVAIGLFLPIAGFVLAEVLNNRVQSKEDIEKITHVPVIGGIGHNTSGTSLVVYNKPRSAMAESFRALRSNLNYFTGNKEHLVFMVTSSIPGEGKSFTTLNLATVLAMTGKKTVIIGADLRKPKLYDDFGLNNNTGISQHLSGLAEVSQIIQPTSVENLSLIPGGPMPPNPSELLLRTAMRTLIDELKNQFDYIVMDTPPLSLVADAFVLSKYADHTIFVVRQDFTPKPALQSLNEYYETNKLSNLSLLFNDLRKTGLGYGYGYGGYGYGYGYSYGYGYGGKKNKEEGSYYVE